MRGFPRRKHGEQTIRYAGPRSGPELLGTGMTLRVRHRRENSGG